VIGKTVFRFRLPWSVRAIGALAVFAIAIGSVRRSFSTTDDFRTTVWDAGRAMLRGSDPYNVGEFHRLFPGQGWLPVYGPPHLWLAVAWAVLPLGVATALWFLFNVAGMFVIGSLVVRCFGRTLGVPAVVVVTGLLILSRPGRASFGQVTVYYVLTSYVVWSQARRRPGLAALALVMALGKPPFGLPLLGLLLLCRAWPVVWRAFVIFVAVSVPVVLWLSFDEGSPRTLWHAIISNVRYSDHTAVDRVGAVRRVDAISLIGRYVHGISGIWEIVAFIVLIGVVGLFMRRRFAWRDRTPPVLLTLGLVSLLSIAHQDYDLLLLAWPFGAMLGQVWDPGRGGLRTFLVLALPALVMCFIPATTTAKLLGLGPDVAVITTLTTACLLLALVGSMAALSSGPPVGGSIPTVGAGQLRRQGRQRQFRAG